MHFAICLINETWTASAFELATEVSVRRTNLNKAVGEDLRSYRAYVAAGFYCDVADGLSLINLDRTERTVMGMLIKRDFITPTPPQLDDPRYAFIAEVTSHLEQICALGPMAGTGQDRSNQAQQHGNGSVAQLDRAADF